MTAPSPFIAAAHVAIGGAIGSVLRYELEDNMNNTGAAANTPVNYAVPA